MSTNATKANAELELPPLQAHNCNDLHLLADDQLNVVNGGGVKFEFAGVTVCLGSCPNIPLGPYLEGMIQTANQALHKPA
jgi:hypothetical protein